MNILYKGNQYNVAARMCVIAEICTSCRW